MKNSRIEWTDHTFNPWWGCSHAGSPGCDHCYARREAKRFGYDCWGPGKPRRTEFGKDHWQAPYRWNRAAEKAGKMAVVMCGSMCDYLDPDAPAGRRDLMYQIIGETRWLFWMLITKRPENLMSMNPRKWTSWGNYAFGVTVETIEQTWRIYEMMRIESDYYFVSHEPALGKVTWPKEFLALGPRALLITGGESGPEARPMQPDWARHDRDQCQAAGVRFCFKQWGSGRPPKRNGQYDVQWYQENEELFSAGRSHAFKKNGGRLLDGREWNERLI